MDEDFLDPKEKRRRRRAAREAKARQAQEDTVIQNFMSNTAGREYIYNLLDRCGIFRPSAHENPYFTYLNEGQRNIGLILLADIMRACPQSYIQMVTESADGRRSYPPDRTDFDDERNYDDAGRWIGEGDGPEDAA